MCLTLIFPSITKIHFLNSPLLLIIAFREILYFPLSEVIREFEFKNLKLSAIVMWDIEKKIYKNVEDFLQRL